MSKNQRAKKFKTIIFEHHVYVYDIYALKTIEKQLINDYSCYVWLAFESIRLNISAGKTILTKQTLKEKLEEKKKKMKELHSTVFLPRTTTKDQ